jgi:hypothetical protein
MTFLQIEHSNGFANDEEKNENDLACARRDFILSETQF